MTQPTPNNEMMSTARVEAFSDGVFAIIVTLLILSIRMPQISRDQVAQQLPRQLLQLWPHILSYVLSFLVVGVYWVAHHNLCKVIVRSDRGLLWLNNLFLMLAAFLPFPAALLGEYGDQQIIIVLYAATLLLTGGCLSLLWYYCTHDRRLVNPQMSRKLVRMVHIKILILPAVAVGAVWISFFSPRLSILVFFGAVLFYLFPSPSDEHLDQHTELVEHGSAISAGGAPRGKASRGTHRK